MPSYVRHGAVPAPTSLTGSILRSLLDILPADRRRHVAAVVRSHVELCAFALTVHYRTRETLCSRPAPDRDFTGRACPFVEFKGLDGYGTCIALEVLLGADVLLADRLNGAPLSPEHGAPVRLVAPSLYGYKNIKHVSLVRLRSDYRRSFAERQTRAQVVPA
jgi:hypothetical protein